MEGINFSLDDESSIQVEKEYVARRPAHLLNVIPSLVLWPVP